MAWYYSDGVHKFGPVSEDELKQLEASAKVTSSTLVWTDGMANWAPYGSVRPAPTPIASTQSSIGAAEAVTPIPSATGPSAFCSQCGRAYSASDLMQIGTARVCAQCKDAYLLQLRQGGAAGVALPGARFGGFWIRVLAIFLDGIISSVLMALIAVPLLGVLALAGLGSDVLALLASTAYMVIAICVGVLYDAWFVSNKGATPGKMVCGLEIIRADGTRPSFGLAVGRYLSKIVSALALYIGFIMVAFDDEKRSLHDRICGTRVIRKTG